MRASKSDVNWELIALAAEKHAGTLPDVAHALTPLISEMRLAHRVYHEERIPDLRLYGTDLTNLMSGLDMIGRLRSAGVSAEKTADAVSDVLALIRDMHVRAERLVNDKVSDVSLHASASRIGVDDEGDVARSPLPVPVMHASASSGKHAKLTCNVLGAKVGGRIHGKVLHAAVSETDRFTHVSPELSFLPEGRAIIINEEALVLWSGDPEEEAFDVLRGPAFRVEAGTGDVEIHGPVFVSRASEPGRVLHKENEFRLKPRPEDKKDAVQLGGMLTNIILSFMLFLGSVVLARWLPLEGFELMNAAAHIMSWGFLVSVFVNTKRLFHYSESSVVISREGWLAGVLRKRRNAKISAAATRYGLIARENVTAPVLTHIPKTEVKSFRAISY